MKKIISLLSLALIISTTIKAQDIEFESTTVDFGTILETEGNVTREFIFTNTGKAPLVISSVRASCGCTTPGWTREPVLPGQKGFVKATYGARGRVSPFNKNLTVTSNGTPNRVVLTIKGNVIEAPIDIKKSFPDEIGELRAKNIRDFHFNEISSKSKSASQILEIANPREAGALKVEILNAPKHLIVKSEPESLEPQQQGVIRISVDGTARNKFGYESNDVKIKVGAVTKTIKISSIVREDIVASEKDSKAILISKVVDGGVATKGKTLSAVVQVKNDGLEDLVLKRVSTDNNLFVLDSKKLPKIKAGETASLKFTAKKTVDGVNKTEVYIETNSPYSNSLLSCTIVGSIE